MISAGAGYKVFTVDIATAHTSPIELIGTGVSIYRILVLALNRDASAGLMLGRGGDTIGVQAGDKMLTASVTNTGELVRPHRAGLYLTNSAQAGAGNITLLVQVEPQVDLDYSRIASAPYQLGNGLYSTLLPALPAAGVECVATVPAGKVWRPISVIVNITTGAPPTPRSLHLGFRVTPIGGGSIFQSLIPAPAQLGESASYGYQWGLGLVERVATVDIPGSLAARGTQALPQSLLLVAGNTIETVTTHLDAVDQYTAFVVVYEEFNA